jgi:hypothetical protein
VDNYQAVYDAVSNAFCMTDARIQEVACEYVRPAAVFRPKVMLDGNVWIALYGENLQDGIVGCGASPDEAMRAFDKAWYEKRAA